LTKIDFFGLKINHLATLLERDLSGFGDKKK
jgi:hypothetical protein